MKELCKGNINLFLLLLSIITLPMCWASSRTKLLQLHLLKFSRISMGTQWLGMKSVKHLDQLQMVKVLNYWRKFSKDQEPIVSQSCEVALSMLECERSAKSFEVNYIYHAR